MFRPATFVALTQRFGGGDELLESPIESRFGAGALVSSKLRATRIATESFVRPAIERFAASLAMAHGCRTFGLWTVIGVRLVHRYGHRSRGPYAPSSVGIRNGALAASSGLAAVGATVAGVPVVVNDRLCRIAKSPVFGATDIPARDRLCDGIAAFIGRPLRMGMTGI